MITKDKESSVISLLFIGVIILLTVGIINNFTIIDCAYLLFVVGCFIRFIYIKTH